MRRHFRRSLVVLSVLAAVLTLSLISLIQPRNTTSTDAIHDFGPGFAYTTPGGWSEGQEAGLFNLGQSYGQSFRLQGRFFNAAQVDVTGTTGWPWRPVFSHSQMGQIHAQNPPPRTVFVIDNTSPSMDNFVLFELTNLTHVTQGGETWFSFTPNNANAPTVNWGHDNLTRFINQGVASNADVRNHARQNLGHIVYNDQNTYSAMFFDEGLYQFNFRITAISPTGLSVVRTLSFSFYIVHSGNYLATPSLDNTFWTTVSAGTAHSFGITAGGELWGWGLTTNGRLGNGVASGNETTPVRIGNRYDWTNISAGETHTLGIAGGELFAWGSEANGRLGNGITTGDQLVPQRIGTRNDWTHISAGSTHSLGIAGGQLFGWGLNTFGRLGDNTTTQRPVPTLINPRTDWTYISAGSTHSLGIAGGELFAWGQNLNGRTGTGVTAGNQLVPYRVGPRTDWTHISAGSTHSLGIAGGELMSWGGAANGRLGNDLTAGDVLSPTRIGQRSDWTNVSAGTSHSLGVANGVLFAWGLNTNGRLGDGTTIQRTTPTRIGRQSGWCTISAGGTSSLGGNTGHINAWGLNTNGQLGDGTITQRTSPIIHPNVQSQGIIEGARPNEFFFNFGGPTPFTEFNQSRFDWTVTHTNPLNPQVRNITGNHDHPQLGPIRHEMLEIGTHNFHSAMIFEFTTHTGVTRRVPVTNFSPYNWSLTVFGFRSYYNGEWFGGEDWDNETNVGADITRQLPVKSSIAETLLDANIYQTWLENNITSRPVVTNSPPVMFNGLGSVAREANEGPNLSRLSFMPARGNEWERRNFSLSEPLVQPGEYIITIYYNFGPAVHGFSPARTEPFFQVFHFRIVDITDVRIRVPDNLGGYDFLHIHQFRDTGIPTAGDLLVFFDGIDAGQESPFNTPTRVELVITEFPPSTNVLETVPNFQNLTKAQQADLFHNSHEGIYTFTIFHGAFNQAHTIFRVLIDRSPIQNFYLEHNGGSLCLGDNHAIVGAGQTQQFGATLTWGNKPSGIGFTNAIAGANAMFFPIQHYLALSLGFVQSNNPGLTHQNAPYRMQTAAGIPMEFEITPNQDNSGWRLTSPIINSGLYIFTIADDVGNESTFTLIVDNTRAAFAQNHQRLPNQDINMVHFNPSNLPIIGFGTHKVIQFLGQPINNILAPELVTLWTAQGFLNGGNLAIPIERVEYSTTVEESSFVQIAPPGHSRTLDADGYYIFRSFDALGNVSYFYIFANSDMARGVILENETSDFHPGGTLGDDVAVVRPQGIANQNFVGFSFLQSHTSNIVEYIDIAFYPMTWQRFTGEEEVSGVIVPIANPNFPFSNQSLFNITHSIDAVQNPGLDELRFLPINHTVEGTPPGIYVITRRLDPSTATSDLVRNHYVIVDNTPIIAPHDPRWISDVRMQFGVKTATHRDFQTFSNFNMMPGNDLVIQTNSTALALLPVGGTKFGHHFNDVQFGGNQLTLLGSNVTFSALNLGVSMERYLGNGQFEMLHQNAVGQTISQNGVYRATFMDGSGGLRWQQFGVGGLIPNRTTRSQILFEITAGNSDAMFKINDVPIQTPALSQGANRTIQATRYTSTDTLTFRYTRSDPRMFFADITSSLITRNGVGLTTAQMNLIRDTDIINQTGTVHEYVLSRLGLNNGDHFVITLGTSDPVVGSLVFEIHIDNTAPQNNLNALKGLDSFWVSTFEYQTYFFSAPHTFLFTADPIGLDSLGLEIFEVQSNRQPLPDGQSVSIPLPHGVPIYSVIGLEREGQDNRFFRITERDRADNIRIYYINVRGNGFIDRISTSGLRDDITNILELGVGDLFGQNVQLTGAQDFWDNNPNFILRIGTNAFRRTAATAQHGTINPAGVLLSPTTINGPSWHNFINVVNVWLQDAQNQHREIFFNNGFGHFTATNLFQKNQNVVAPMIHIERVLGTTQLDVVVQNFNQLPSFYHQVDGQAPRLHLQLRIDNLRGPGVYNTVISSNGRFRVMQSQNLSLSPAYDELLFTITDNFGNTTRAEHNGHFGNHIHFDYRGGSRTHPSTGDLRYTGDPRGVAITFTTNVHNVTIWRDGISAGNYQQFVDPETGRVGSHTILEIRPDNNVRERWEVRIYSQATGNLVFHEVWVFYTILPQTRGEDNSDPFDLEWTNLSGDFQQILPRPETNVFNGILQLNIRHTPGLFATTISFERTFPNPNNPQATLTERRTLLRGETRLVLNRAGAYVVTISNEVWTQRTYLIYITDVDNTTYNVYFDNTLLRASPQSFFFTGTNRYIPHYFLLSTDTAAARELANINEPNLEILSNTPGLQIVPTRNFPRGLVRPNSAVHYHTRQIGNPEVVIYALRSPGTDTATLFLAISVIDPITVGDGLSQSNISVNLVANESGPVHLTYYTIGQNNPLLIRVGNTQGGAAHLFNQHPGNLIFVDYYVNRHPDGNPDGTFRSGESLTLSHHHHGVFRFVIRDWAGRTRQFEHIVSGQSAFLDYFTITSLSRVPILVGNDAQGFDTVNDGLVFNDELVIRPISIPFSPHVTSHMRIHDLTATRNGSPMELPELDHQNPFRTSLPGSYEFTIVYRIMAGTYRTRTFTAQVVNARMPIESFSFAGGDNLTIANVSLRGISIISRFTRPVTELYIDTSTGIGRYEITIGIADDGVRAARTHQFEIQVAVFDNATFGGAIQSSVAWGTSTTSENTSITIDTALLSMFMGSGGIAEITLNGSTLVLGTGTSSWGFSANWAENDIYVHIFGEETGNVRVTIRDDNGIVRFSQGFEITAPMSTVVVLLIIAAVSLLIVGIIIFVILRNKMRVR